MVQRFQTSASLAFAAAALFVPAMIGEGALSSGGFAARFGAFLLSAGTCTLEILLLLRLRDLLCSSAAPRFLDSPGVSARLTVLVWVNATTLVLSLRVLGPESPSAGGLDVLEYLALITAGVFTFILGTDLVRAAPNPLRRLRAFAVLQFPLGVAFAVVGFVGLLPSESERISDDELAAGVAVAVLALAVIGGLLVASKVYLGLVFLDAVQFFRGEASVSGQREVTSGGDS